MLAARCANNWVLPVPGPAITKTGPSIVSTAKVCAAVSPFNSCCDICYLLYGIIYKIAHLHQN